MRTLLILTVLLREQARNLRIPPTLSDGLDIILNRIFGHTAEIGKENGGTSGAGEAAKQ